MLAGADDVAIGQKAAVIDGVNLAGRSFFKEPILVELMIKMLGDLVVLRRVRPAEQVEGQSESVPQILLQVVHLSAIFLDR
jgi:hypothetical protein